MLLSTLNKENNLGFSTEKTTRGSRLQRFQGRNGQLENNEKKGVWLNDRGLESPKYHLPEQCSCDSWWQTVRPSCLVGNQRRREMQYNGPRIVQYKRESGFFYHKLPHKNTSHLLLKLLFCTIGRVLGSTKYFCI